MKQCRLFRVFRFLKLLRHISGVLDLRRCCVTWHETLWRCYFLSFRWFTTCGHIPTYHV